MGRPRTVLYPSLAVLAAAFHADGLVWSLVIAGVFFAMFAVLMARKENKV